jgi:AraC-like DNA-binding protein
MKRKTIDMENNFEDKELKPKKVKVISQGEKFRRDLEKVVEKNLSDPEFGINTLCDKLYVTRATLFRKVKTYTGKPPKEFIKSYRLDRAAQLLREDFGNVTEVSGEVGFSDPYYFSKCFKKKTGKPPRQYQQEQLEASKSREESIAEPGSNGIEIQMDVQLSFQIKAFDRELIARSFQLPKTQIFHFPDNQGTPERKRLFNQVGEFMESSPDLNMKEELKNTLTKDILSQLLHLITENKTVSHRNAFYSDERLEFYDITDKKVRMNARSVAAVCFSMDLIPGSNDFFKLSTKTYGPTFNLHRDEMFYNEPIAAGRICSGVLVGRDTIIIPPHFAYEKSIKELRFIFDLVMEDPVSPVEKIPLSNIYKAAAIIDREFAPGIHWALVKLDRPVSGREAAIISPRKIFEDQPLYVIGHPCGLPLKYAPGANAAKIIGKYFRADLDVYSGGIGSPVFSAETHELIGAVSGGKTADYRWTEEGWITLRYPKSTPGSFCTRASQFAPYLGK